MHIPWSSFLREKKKIWIMQKYPNPQISCTEQKCQLLDNTRWVAPRMNEWKQNTLNDWGILISYVCICVLSTEVNHSTNMKDYVTAWDSWKCFFRSSKSTSFLNCWPTLARLRVDNVSEFFHSDATHCRQNWTECERHLPALTRLLVWQLMFPTLLLMASKEQNII